MKEKEKTLEEMQSWTVNRGEISTPVQKIEEVHEADDTPVYSYWGNKSK